MPIQNGGHWENNLELDMKRKVYLPRQMLLVLIAMTLTTLLLRAAGLFG